MIGLYKKIKLAALGIFFVGVFLCSATHASAATFYFTNTIDQSPVEIGNYFDDDALSIPSTVLPISTDEIFVTSGSVYDGNIVFNNNAINDGEVTGNAIFNDSSINNGVVDGDAVFNGDLSEDGNTILGTKTRMYTSNTTTTRDFSNNWIVVADGVVVDITNASDDSTTVYQKPNGGSYVYDTSIYYFNNAVDTSPNTLGNYWHNEGLNRPALSLPDFITGVISIAAGATFQGNAVFNSDSSNNGTVTGNAVFNDNSSNNGTVSVNALFNGDASQNSGIVTCTKTRKYTADISLTKDFVADGPWTVLADGAIVNVLNAISDNTTTFTTANNGRFVDIVLLSAYVYQSTITLTYSGAVDATSIPAAGDFVVLNNGATLAVSGVSISGSQVILTIASPVLGGSLSLTYVLGGDPLQSTNHTALILQNEPVRTIIPTAKFPGSSTVFNNKLYLSTDPANGGAADIVIINPQTNTVLNTITLGIATYWYAGVGNKLYAMDYGSGTVSIISTETDQLISTFPLVDPDTSSPLVPYRAVVVGTDLYIAGSGGGTVAVLDTNTDTVTHVIHVGGAPYYLLPYKDKVYSLSYTNHTINVISTVTKNIIKTFTAADGLVQPKYAVVAHDKIFVANDGTLSIIDYASDTISGTNTTHANNIILANDKLYLAGPEEIWVHSATTGAFLTTTMIGTFGGYGTTSGNTIFITGGNKLNMINTTTDTLSSIDVVGAQYAPSIYGDSIYISSTPTKMIVVIDKNSLPSLVPNLISFSTSAASGTYTPGQSLIISANFGRTLQSGSTMTVLLNNGASVVLNQVSGNTLSGTYTIGSGQSTPDLSVRSIYSASVSDGMYTSTAYDLPSSLGLFVGENSAITRNLGDAKNIQIGDYDTYTTGSNPYQLAITGGNIYVANQGSNTVSVIKQSDKTLVATIPVGEEPYGLVLSGTKLYVANVNSNTVSVINTTNNTVVDTISVGIKPYYVATIGTNVYVTNGASNTVSVINTATNTVTNTIAVGSYPRGIKAHGTDLYVANYGDPNYSGGNSISIINSLTNTVSDTIVLPAGSDGPRGVTVLGSEVYVTNYRSNNVSVIYTTTNTIVQTIAVGAGPRGIVGLGTKMYVENFDDGTISVIDSINNTVSSTVTVGHSPSGMAVSGTDIYVTSFQDDKVYILDTTTNLLKTIATVVTTPTPVVSSGGGGGGRYIEPVAPVVVASAKELSTPTTSQFCGIVFTKKLKIKSKNKEVGAFQTCMNIRQNAGLKIDNYFGVKTRAALIDFQKKNKLKATGILDVKTRSKINKLVI